MWADMHFNRRSGWPLEHTIEKVRYGFLAIAVALSYVSAEGQSNPQALQSRGIATLENVIEQVRRNGAQASVLSQYDAAARDLELSYRAFAATSSFVQEELSLIKLADCERQQALFARMTPSALRQGETQHAADTLAGRSHDHYLQGAELARKTGTSAHLVKALTGLALVEETQYHDYGAASSAVTEAVRAATSCRNSEDCRQDALEAKVALETARGELISAASHVNGLLTMLKRNPSAPAYMQYRAYTDRASIYYGMTDGCTDTFEQPTDDCYRLFDLSKEDWATAKTIAARAGYDYFARMAQQEIGDLDDLRHLTEQHNNHSNIPAGMFDPKVAKDVSATEIPPLGQLPRKTVEAIQAMAESAGPSLPGPIATYFQAEVDDMQGRTEAALEEYVRAIRSVNEERQRLGEESARSSFLEDKTSYYDRPITMLLLNHRYAEAFELIEGSRARGTADLLRTKSLGLARPVDRQLFATLALKRANIAALQSKFFLSIYSSNPDEEGNADDVADAQMQLTELEEDYQKLLLRVAREAPLAQNVATSKAPSLQSVQKVLREDGADMVYYYLRDTAVILLHIGPDSVHVRNVFLPRFLLREKLAQLLDSMQKQDMPFRTDLSKQLYLFLIQPILEWVHSDHLILIPQGELQGLPFQALQDPTGVFLGERFQLSYSPSAAILLRLKKQRNLAGGSLLAAANPKLPTAREEVNSIASLYPNHQKVWIDTLIRKSEFERWAGSYDIVHLAVHGEFEGEPLLSHINLAADGKGDGVLNAAEMFGLSLEHTRLVVLSACETGRVHATRSNEVQGIPQALLFAGAQSLLVSAWEVDDKPTTEWMKIFYREAQTKSLAEAAREAVRERLRDPAYKHPRYWAPFLLIAR
jgi:CHAT domain-containing protein